MDVTEAATCLTVSPLGSGEEPAWSEFLARSTNATLFHELAFLDYHPANRHRFHHLVFRRGKKIVAVLPGGLCESDGELEFHSLPGASFGGFAWRSNTSAETAIALVHALVSHAQSEGWRDIEITLPQSRICKGSSELQSFALFCLGFQLKHRWLCHGVEVPAEGNRSFETLFRPRQATAVRASEREGITSVQSGIEGLDPFLAVLHDTYDRHGSPPTHSDAEIRDLLQRLPDRIKIQLALLDSEPVAGLLIFKLTPSVASTFYICTAAAHANKGGAALAIADAIDTLALEGVRHLDFGPSASDVKFNRGVAFFKEGLGATGSCRDRWHWHAS